MSLPGSGEDSEVHYLVLVRIVRCYYLDLVRKVRCYYLVLVRIVR